MHDFDAFAGELRDQPLAPAAQEQHLALLRSLPDPGERPVTPAARRRRGRVIGGLAIGAVLAVGGGTAVAIGAFSTATDTATGYCYASADLDESVTNRMEFAAAGTPDRPEDASAVALDVCAAYWRSGVFAGGRGDPDRAPTGGSAPVPSLVACVLPDGKAGVFPGDATTCHGLGLSTLRP
ncbi:hypothetical protein [Nakamurella leprariae]|uniref:Uncharacterized protein n=1 Tax=Nakamurella leprariae TaxID=2803911 RepID=A0A938YF07_9ACTN|nr:hypothetical protein [Nakamurella leprariae]MBM9466640.1 hypothetical protein [Nakamurella leprariae]